MSVFSSLLGRRPSRERPDLAAWVADRSPVLVIDGDGSGASYSGARVVRHEVAGVQGLPFHFPDKRRLPARDAEFGAVVLADVLSKVIDVGAALDEVRRVAQRDGLVLVAQSVAPEDFEQRAIWNAIAKMRDARHASAPSARQLAAMLSGAGMPIVREAAWEATTDGAATSRPDAAQPLVRMFTAAAARGAKDVVEGGALVIAWRAYLLRRT